MAFAKFNICSPCCNYCVVDYSAYTCQRGLGYIPLYSSLWPDYVGINNSGILSYIVECTGRNFTQCNCYGITDIPLSEPFYIFADPSTSGKHRFAYTPQAGKHYAILTKSNDNQIFPIINFIGGFDPITSICVDMCSGIVNAVMQPTGWVGGQPCWFKTDYITNAFGSHQPYFSSSPLKFDLDITSYQDYQRIREGEYFYCYTGFLGCSYTELKHPSCCRVFTLPGSTFVEVISSPNTFSFTLDKYRTIGLFSLDFVSDGQILNITKNYTLKGSYMPCIGTFTTEDDVSVFYSYIAATRPSITCLSTIGQILGCYSDTQAPIASSYPSFVGGTSRTPHFHGPTAMADADDFISKIPQVIATGVTYIFPPAFLTFAIGPTTTESYSCPGSVTMRQLYYNTAVECDETPISGYLHLTISQP